jgi:hypothetical protein
MANKENQNPALTISFNEDGEIISVTSADGRTIYEPTHNLRDNPITDADLVGLKSFEVLFYRHRQDGTLRRCPHTPSCDLYCP